MMYVTRFKSKLFGSYCTLITDFPLPFHRLSEMANYDNDYDSENKWKFVGEASAMQDVSRKYDITDNDYDRAEAMGREFDLDK